MQSHHMRAAERAQKKGLPMPPPSPYKKIRRKRQYVAVELHPRPSAEKYAELLAEDKAEDAAREGKEDLDDDDDNVAVSEDDDDEQRSIADSASEVSD